MLSCGAAKKDNTKKSMVKSSYIAVIANYDNDSVSMYTDDGHVFLCTTDSFGDYVVFFAKFDANAPSRYNMVKDKIVRVQIDLSQHTIRSITSIHGGAFCSLHDNVYEVTCFDEQMKLHHYKKIDIQYDTRADSVSIESDEFKISHEILTQLMISYRISCVMSDNGVNGWYNIQTALEPIRQLDKYDFIRYEKIYNNKILKYFNKMKLATDGLNHFCCQLQDLQK